MQATWYGKIRGVVIGAIMAGGIGGGIAARGTISGTAAALPAAQVSPPGLEQPLLPGQPPKRIDAIEKAGIAVAKDDLDGAYKLLLDAFVKNPNLPSRD
jgi:hypothetical protein